MRRKLIRTETYDHEEEEKKVRENIRKEGEEFSSVKQGENVRNEGGKTRKLTK